MGLNGQTEPGKIIDAESNKLQQEQVKAEEANSFADAVETSANNQVQSESQEETLAQAPAVQAAALKHIKIKISNMVCESCEKRIEKSLEKIPGVKHVKASYVESTAKITYDPKKVSLEKIASAIKEAGYGSELSPSKSRVNNKMVFAAIGIIALAALIISYFAVSATLGQMNISIPELDVNTSAVIIFFVGLLTGFHCIGMCGSFVLSYTAKARQENPKALNLSLHGQYALGKIISYSAIGGIFGLIGSVFVFSPAIRAAIAILAGAFLILFGLKMLNVHPVLRKLSLPQGFFSRLRIGPLKKSSNPMLVGLANGLFIACGPLQAMYILAMTAGSFIGGAKILLAFAVGTLMPMLGFGVFASLISHTMQNKIVRLSGAIVLIMGLFMINNGLALSGNQVSFPIAAGDTGQTGTVNPNNGPGYQVISMDVVSSGYSPNSFVLKTGIPVKWVINGKQVNGCNGTIIVPAYNLNIPVKQGEQTIEFTPTKAGVINWSCWMGMIQGTFIVRDDVGIDSTGKVVTSAQTQQAISQQVASAPKPKGGCGCGGGGSGSCSAGK
ncbi:MAG: sulfite exporter TauE/SafE family protein [Candidatus ainarchaeum sp.]|nr:sulfite exporter TauE/SafE family protein [Candidatus ainarchaeum sp.]